jgi:hypothetical protein
MAARPPTRKVPVLDWCVESPADWYAVGERGEERVVSLQRVTIGRWPVVNAQLRAFIDATRRAESDVPAAKLDDPSSPSTRRPT